MANPSVLLAPTNITTGYTIPSLAAGSNRILIITVCMYNGGGTCSVPSTVTVNGVSATWVKGDAIGAVETKVASASYIILESGIASISGQVVSTSGQSGTVKNMTVMMIQDSKQGSPSSSAFQRVNSGNAISMPLTRLADSCTVSFAYNHLGGLVSLTNPTKVGSIIFISGGGLNYAYANDTTATSNITTNASGYISAHAMNFEVFSTINVDTINGGASNPTVHVDSSNTAATTGLDTITATTFTDSSGFVSTATPTMPSGDGSFVFAWPWADGSQQAKFGSVTASMTDGTLTATLPSTMSLPSTYSSTTWSGATDLGEFYLGHYLTLTNDNRVYYQTIIDGITVTINADGWMSFSDLPVTVPLLLHDCRSGGTGLITTKTLIVTESGAVVVTGGLTSSGLTSSGLTRVGLTSTGL